MKRRLFLVWAAIFILGCGSTDPKDNYKTIIVKTADYFLFSWDFWKQSKDTEQRWRLEGLVENISEDDLKDAELTAQFFIDQEKVDEITFKLNEFKTKTTKDFVIATRYHPKNLTRGEIRLSFRIKGIDNIFISDPEVLDPLDFLIDED